MSDAPVVTDLEFIRNPDMWGLFPHLPVLRKRDDSPWPQAGTVISHSLEGPLPEPVTVYLGTIYDDDLRQRPTIEYPTAEAMVADGWRVD